jgi:hypothetical protein
MENAHRSAHMKNRRYLRNWLICPEFQVPLIVFNLVINGLILLVFWVAGQTAIGELAPAATLSGVGIDFYRKVLHYQASRLHVIFLVGAISSTVLSTVMTLYLSHRIAGPMVSLRRYFQAIKDGVDPVPTLFFRDHDFLLDIPPLINDSIAALIERLGEKRRKSV